MKKQRQVIGAPVHAQHLIFISNSFGEMHEAAQRQEPSVTVTDALLVWQQDRQLQPAQTETCCKGYVVSAMETEAVRLGLSSAREKPS